MKPVRLELQGFTAFRDQAVLDFEGRRLFVITGPTGAGKSSLLDAMTWALFGRVPRVGTQVAQLLAQGAQSMHVMLEFETRARRFRIARRAGAKGPGAVRLERRDAAGAWEPLADKTSDVKELVERLLGMDYPTFTRTMLLPQGAFDAFLRGEPADRREILSRLIGLDVYERARQIAGNHATEAKARADTLRAQVASLNLATPERIASLRAELADAQATLASLATRHEALRALGDHWRAYEEAQRSAAEAATEAAAAAAALQSAQDALAQAEQAEQRAQQQVARVDAERAALAYDAKAHEALRVQVALLDQRDAAERDLAAARTALVGAERAHAEAEAAAALAVQSAKRAARTLQQAQVKAEAARVALEEAAASAVAGRDQQMAAAHAHAAEATAAREEADAARTRAGAIEQIAARLTAEAEAERDAVAAHTEATRDARASAREATAATKAHAAAEKALDVARARAEAAAQANAAAALARGLKKGDRCPICGEVLKAAPKHAKGDLDSAEAAVAEAERVLREAAATASTAAATSAVANERLDARATALAAAAARRAAIEGEVTALGITPADLPKQAAREAKAAEQAQARALRAEQAAERARSLGQDFAVALGALASTPAGQAEPASTPAALTKAIEVAATAERAHLDATTASERAAHEADSAQRLVALSEQAVRTARGHEQEAAGRLDRLGTADGDPAALRAAFAAAEQAAVRDAQLAQAAADARAACAAAEQGVAGARQALDAAQAAEAQRSARLKREREVEQGAHQKVAADWPKVLGAGTPAKATLAGAMREHQEAQNAAAQRTGALGQAIEQAEQQVEQAKAATAEIATHDARHRLSRELHTELQSNHFVDFLLRESLELLAQDASTRLMQFSMGRYELVTEKGDFLVTDHQNGDDRRSVRTLSGGETFLASLALALSLSEHLPEISGTGGAVSLESLFLDEGFGSLDAESLDLAVQGLEALADGNRMVGVISHVEELSERLPSRVHVEKHAHSSIIRAGS